MLPNQKKIEWLQAEWLKRPKELRQTESHILLFKSEVQQRNPVMLNLRGVSGDVYQFLKTILEVGN